MSNVQPCTPLLSALCRSLMAMDGPKDLTPDERQALEDHTNVLATDQGYTGWVQAFHGVKS